MRLEINGEWTSLKDNISLCLEYVEDKEKFKKVINKRGIILKIYVLGVIPAPSFKGINSLVVYVRLEELVGDFFFSFPIYLSHATAQEFLKGKLEKKELVYSVFTAIKNDVVSSDCALPEFFKEFGHEPSYKSLKIFYALKEFKEKILRFFTEEEIISFPD